MPLGDDIESMHAPSSLTLRSDEELGGGILQNDHMPYGPSRGPADVELKMRLLSLIEDDQCLAFVPGSRCGSSREEILEIARISLFHSRRIVRKLERFLQEEGSVRRSLRPRLHSR